MKERGNLAKGAGHIDLVKGDIGLNFLLKALEAGYTVSVTWMEGLTGSGMASFTDSMARASLKGPLGAAFSDCDRLHGAIVISHAKFSAAAAEAAGCNSSSGTRLSGAHQGVLTICTDNAPMCATPPSACTASLRRSTWLRG